MKKISAVIMIILVMASVLMLGSCSKGNVDDVRPTVEALVEASFELNDIYYGTGLPASDKTSGTVATFLTLENMTIDQTSYLPVSGDSKYQTEDSVVSATKKVFSEEYSDIMYKRAFEGYENDDGEYVQEPRYMTKDGYFLVNTDLSDEFDLSDRTYDYDTLDIIYSSSSDMIVTVDTTVDGSDDVESVKLTLVKESGEWRLDSPTY